MVGRKVRIKDPKDAKEYEPSGSNPIDNNNNHVKNSPADYTPMENKKNNKDDKNISTVPLDEKSSRDGEKYALCSDEGVYSCAGCSTPLFYSYDKLGSNVRKPSFKHAISPTSLVFAEDYSYGICRVLASCAKCGKIVGHTYNKNTEQEVYKAYSQSLCIKRPPEIKKYIGLAVVFGIVAAFVGYKLLKK